MNHCGVVSQVNQFTVFSQGNPSLTQVTGAQSDIQTVCECECECVCALYNFIQSVMSVLILIIPALVFSICNLKFCSVAAHFFLVRSHILVRSLAA